LDENQSKTNSTDSTTQDQAQQENLSTQQTSDTEPNIETKKEPVVVWGKVVNNEPMPKPIPKPKVKKPKQLPPKREDVPENKEENKVEDSNSLPNDNDDDDDWITPSNIQKHKAKALGTPAQTSNKKVGCCTTDFAMQNVLIQMGLTLLSVDGFVMKKLKMWMLQCYACSKTTRDMEKKFCPACGNSTLRKVSYVITKRGKTLIFGGDRPVSKRGKIYPIPKAKGGRHNNDIVLSEHEYKQRIRKTKKNQSLDAFDPDFVFAGIDAHKISNVVVGYGNKKSKYSKKEIR